MESECPEEGNVNKSFIIVLTGGCHSRIAKVWKKLQAEMDQLSQARLEERSFI